MQMQVSPPERYHSLDALRAAMMLLGLVLHSAASYIHSPIGWAWPYHDSQTNAGFDLLIVFIHIFRMPVFFVIAGFFAALLYTRDGGAGFSRNRARRVLLPLLFFWPAVIPLTLAGFALAAKQVGGPMPWELVRDRPALQRPVLGHLWFLYYLLLFYAAALLAVPIAARLSASSRVHAGRIFHAVATTRWGIVVLAGATALTLLPMEAPTIETAAGLFPPVRVLAAYGLFFTFGWLLYGHRDIIDTLATRWVGPLALGIVASILYLVILIARRAIDPALWHLSGVIVVALATWLLIFGITGACVRFLKNPHPLVRYFSDASYWIYLWHVVPITWCAALLATSPAPATMKFFIVLFVTTIVTTVSYHYLVRSTAIGQLLSGRRYGSQRSSFTRAALR